MALYAQILNSRVVAIVDLATEADIQKLATHSQHVMEVTNAATQVGWVFDGRSLSPPVGVDAVTMIESQVLAPAVAFASRITSRFTAENIAMGITQAGKTEIIGDALRDLSFWMDKGSLYVALSEIQNLKAGLQESWSPFITLPRLIAFENQVRAYLGLPTI